MATNEIQSLPIPNYDPNRNPNPTPNRPGFRVIRVVIPYHLRMLAKITGEIQLDVEPPVTLGSVLDALEASYPMLKGTVRDHITKKRRDFIRFYACEQDLSHESADVPLPEAVVKGVEPFLVIGAIAGG